MTLWIRCALYLFLLLGTVGVRAEVPTDVAGPAQDGLVAAPDEADSEAELPRSIPVPELESPVTDLTATLGSDWIASMKQRLLALQQRKGSQIAILMLPSTGADSIEQFATRVFEQWRLGRQGVDDGVLVLVAKEDRTMRIEVGYGLEGAIPDVVAGRIIREEMVPAFRSGDFAGGIENAVTVLERLIDGETLPDERHSGGLTWEGWLLLVGLVGGGVAGVVLRRRWLGVKVVLPTLAVATVLMAVSAGLRSLPMLLMAIPFSMIFGAGIGALAAGSRLSAGIVGGVIGYLVALMVCAKYFDGGDVALYGLALPIGGCIGVVLLCLPFVLAYKTWRRSRVEFAIRLAVALLIAGAVIHVSGVLQQPWAFPDSLALIPMLFFPLLFAFVPGGSGSGGSGGSSSGGGSSSSGSSYSGGGGSSGGGGASGSW
ncbi:TPM domain-containing protein [Pseudomonas sp. PDM18]|uniref:TPM domain-containing protein n=1 Tax=unclassified Pseudomonas TaxID=196821 RepID=UPI0017831963|nr:TPM domain-containing protein [Pseudomonas sp. PDM18]MBD9677233.1 TPM domain-containing protein [Pseudomonas sp. PDM18]